MKLEDAVRIFHDSAECPGVIISDDADALVCAECGVVVAQFTDTRVLDDILELLAALPPEG